MIFSMTLNILESTTLALITRMYDPDSGQVIIMNRAIIDIKTISIILLGIIRWSRYSTVEY
jgi:ABC-type branched-subunit amino acid transport system ATPase component